MGNSTSKYSANARVYVLLDDYEPENLLVHASKTLYKVKSLVQVDSKLSVDSGGNATVTFNDKDMKFWKYIKFKYANSKEWGNEQLSGKSAENLADSLKNLQEISDFRKHLQKYRADNKAINALKVLAGSSGSDELEGGIVLPLFTPQNLIWIHYLGRDGYWYSGFTGVITQMSVNETAGKTSTFTINAKTPDIFFENSQLLIRTQNIGGADAVQNSKLEDIDNLAMTNVFSGKITSEIIVDTINKVNNFFLNTKRKNVKFDYDPRYFKVRKLFGFGDDVTNTKSSDGTSESLKLSQAGEQGYFINDEKFRNKRWHYDTTLSIADDFYNGLEVRKNNSQVTTKEGDWKEVVMDRFFYDSSDKVKPFQNLIATSLDLFTVDKMTAKEVLDTVRKTVFCYIYFEGDGNLRVERPYFDIHLGMLDSEIQRSELPPDYDYRYLISKKDLSYINHSYSENSSGIVTRTEMSIKPDWITLSSQIEKPIFSGKSESSWKTTFKFGEKQVQLNSIVSPKFALGNKGIKDAIIRSYCYAMRMLLSSEYRGLTLQLDQRPDLQLNRNMLFLDLGMYFVTKEIAHSFIAKENRLNTSVVGTYVRPVGMQLVNPYRFIIQPDGSLTDWDVVDKWKEGAFNSTLEKTTEKNNPQEVMQNGETFDSLEEFARNKYSTLDNLTNQHEDFDKLYSSEGEQKNPYIICFRGLNDSHTDRQDFFDDFYLMVPSSKTVYKVGKDSGYKQMSCGDSQSAGTHITAIEDNYFIDSNKTKPVFNKYTRLAEGVYRYNREGQFFKCPNFKYYDLNSSFVATGDVKSNSKVVCASSYENNKTEEVDYISYMGSTCKHSYNQSNSSNFMFLAEPKGTWWEGVNIFPASDAVSEFDSIISNIADKPYVDVFVTNFEANDEQSIQDGIKNSNTNVTPLSLNEQQKLFYVLKLMQKSSNLFKTSSNRHKEWKEPIIPSISLEEAYTKLNTQLQGLYCVKKSIIALPEKDYNVFIDYTDITNSKQKQDAWFSSYYNKILDSLNTTKAKINGHSLNSLFDLMSECNVDSSGNVKRVSTDADTRPKNYPIKGLGTNFPIKNNRASLIAMFHLFLQKNSILSWEDMVYEIDGFIEATETFFKWKSFSENYNTISSGGTVTMSELPDKDMNMFPVAQMFGLETGTITYYDLFNLINSKISL